MGVGGVGGGLEVAAELPELVVVGGVVCTLADGGGGALGTFSAGIEEADDGVAGVATVVPGVCGSSRLREPGKNAGSELSIEFFSPVSGFEESANHL